MAARKDEEMLRDTEDVDTPLSSISLWNDVKPIIQPDSSQTAVNIAYLPVFKETMDFFRAIVASQELSYRVLALTKRVITLNAANYTAWHIRRQCLYELKCDLRKELSEIEESILNSPKNYQVWYHRRALVEKLGDATAEPAFVAQVLNETDTKNYLAWAHRQWAVSTYGLWDGELEFSDYLIRDDVRNNSAWNHRWFVLIRAGKVPQLSNEQAAAELAYAYGKASLSPSNEAVMNYIRAVAQKSPAGLRDEELIQFLAELLLQSTGSAVALRALLIDVYLARGDKSMALKICMELANMYDPVRREYWRWRATTIAENA